MKDTSSCHQEVNFFFCIRLFESNFSLTYVNGDNNNNNYELGRSITVRVYTMVYACGNFS